MQVSMVMILALTGLGCENKSADAPETVPAGNVARSTSTGPRPGRRRPDTCDVRCITWL